MKIWPPHWLRMRSALHRADDNQDTALWSSPCSGVNRLTKFVVVAILPVVVLCSAAFLVRLRWANRSHPAATPVITSASVPNHPPMDQNNLDPISQLLVGDWHDDNETIITYDADHTFSYANSTYKGDTYNRKGTWKVDGDILVQTFQGGNGSETDNRQIVSITTEKLINIENPADSVNSFKWELTRGKPIAGANAIALNQRAQAQLVSIRAAKEKAAQDQESAAAREKEQKDQVSAAAVEKLLIGRWEERIFGQITFAADHTFTAPEHISTATWGNWAIRDGNTIFLKWGTNHPGEMVLTDQMYILSIRSDTLVVNYSRDVGTTRTFRRSDLNKTAVIEAALAFTKEAIKSIGDAYVAALHQFASEAHAKGDIDEVVAANHEIERFSATHEWVTMWRTPDDTLFRGYRDALIPQNDGVRAIWWSFQRKVGLTGHEIASMSAILMEKQARQLTVAGKIDAATTLAQQAQAILTEADFREDDYSRNALINRDQHKDILLPDFVIIKTAVVARRNNDPGDSMQQVGTKGDTMNVISVTTSGLTVTTRNSQPNFFVIPVSTTDFRERQAIRREWYPKLAARIKLGGR